VAAVVRQVDVVVLGLGPGGRGAASQLAQAGLDVVGIDERLVGGECPFYGCTPTKMMVRAAELLAESRRVPALAGTTTVEPDWSPVAARVSGEATHQWTDDAEVAELTGSGVTFVRGHGRLAGPRTVAVGDGHETYEARRGVVLATGTRPSVPPVDGLAATPFWTNRDVVRLSALPESLAVLGGGSIGAELCQVFGRFNVAVTLLEVDDRILPAAEPEASALVAEALTDEGIQVVTGREVTRVDHVRDRFQIALGTTAIEADRLLVATGRTGNLDDIGLETVGLDPAMAAIDCDEHMRVAEGLWAIGDITGKGAYTHVAHYQASIAVADILRGDGGPTADYRAVPHVTFTEPEVGSVGMTEAQAREAGLRVRVGRADLAASPRGWLHGRGNAGLVKVVEDAGSGVLVGATVAGPRAGELLGQLTLAVHARVPSASLETMIYAFPTFYETVKQALQDLH
jgi:pyruvate/2-oxoglutarate dehydrogenase complex dihydrolipoamide dehydrogenase (E3) component